MPLPKRPAPYVLGLLVLLLMVLTAWLFRAVTSPQLLEAVKRQAAGRDGAGGESRGDRSPSLDAHPR